MRNKKLGSTKEWQRPINISRDNSGDPRRTTLSSKARLPSRGERWIVFIVSHHKSSWENPARGDKRKDKEIPRGGRSSERRDCHLLLTAIFFCETPRDRIRVVYIRFLFFFFSWKTHSPTDTCRYLNKLMVRRSCGPGRCCMYLLKYTEHKTRVRLHKFWSNARIIGNCTGNIFTYFCNNGNYKKIVPRMNVIPRVGLNSIWSWGQRDWRKKARYVSLIFRNMKKVRLNSRSEHKTFRCYKAQLF